jgi:hypothetical protein
MELSVQIYATIASTPRERPTVTLEQDAGWTPEMVLMLVRRGTLLTLPGIKHQFLGPPVRNLLNTISCPASRLSLISEKFLSQLAVFTLIQNSS